MRFVARQVVSLGGWCQATHQVKARFGKTGSSPFDWLVTPLAGLIACLDDDGRRLGSEVVVKDNVFAICHAYGLNYHHEFPRHESRPVLSEAALRQCREKLGHKYREMADACAAMPTLFVKLGGHADPPVPWPYYKEAQPLRAADIEALVRALDARFPTCDYRLLVVAFDGVTTLDLHAMSDPRVIVRTLPREAITPSPNWQGRDDIWSEMFDNLDIDFAVEGVAAGAAQEPA